MRNTRVRLASLAAKKYLYLATRFNKSMGNTKLGVRHKFYDGVLFKTKVDKARIVTDVIALPVNVLALNITSRDTDAFINGTASHVRNVDLAKISRDVFYVNGANVDDLSAGAVEGTAAALPEPFAFGEPMPVDTPSVVYNGFTGKLSEGYATTRSSRAYDVLSTQFPPAGAPWVSPTEKFWVEVVLCLGGDRYRRFTFSEAWLRQYAPGHDMISRAHRNRITTHYIAACSNGQRLAISVPMTIGGPYNEITNNFSWGAYNALTLCIDMDGVDGPEVLWSSLWDRRVDGDARTGPYEYWPESPFDDSDYTRPPLSGFNQNTVIDTLEMAQDGTVFGNRIISTMIKLPEFRTNPAALDYQQDLLLLPFGGQLVRYVEWAPDGVPSGVLAAENCEAGLFFYNKLLAETALPAGIKNTVRDFLLSYDVQNTVVSANGISVGALYRPQTSGVGYDGGANYLFLPSELIYKDGGNPDIDATGARISPPDNSTDYAVVKKEGGVFSATIWRSSEVRFETVGAKFSASRVSAPGMDKEGLSGNYTHQNFRAPRAAFIGSGVFAIPAADADIATVVMLLAFMSATGFYTKPLPGAGADNTTIGDESVRVIQEELPQSDVSAPPISSVLALTDDSGAYISNDGGDNWVRVIVSQRYADLAYIGSEFLVRSFDKTKPVR
jgi:hypothetical protein